jgi:hypothetical protein
MIAERYRVIWTTTIVALGLLPELLPGPTSSSHSQIANVQPAQQNHPDSKVNLKMFWLLRRWM